MGRPDDARAGAERRCAGKLHGLLHKLRDVRGNDKGIGAGRGTRRKLGFINQISCGSPRLFT